MLPAESVTLLAVAPEEFQTPTSTTIRSPAATADPGVTASDPPCPCADTCCTNDGLAAEATGGALVKGARDDSDQSQGRNQKTDGEYASLQTPLPPRDFTLFSIFGECSQMRRLSGANGWHVTEITCSGLVVIDFRSPDANGGVR